MNVAVVYLTNGYRRKEKSYFSTNEGRCLFEFSAGLKSCQLQNVAGGVGRRYFAYDEAVAGSNPAREVIPGSSVWIERLAFVRNVLYPKKCRFCSRLFPG